MSTRLYPLYQKGNPQLRVFLPNFWMKMIRPKEPIPPYMVLFQTSIEMTEHDIKNYLEKIYKVPVVEVKATIKQGVIRRAYGKQYLVKDEDYKEALVTMPRDHKFTFPDVIPPEKIAPEAKAKKELKAEMSKFNEGIKKVGNVPSWFLW